MSTDGGHHRLSTDGELHSLLIEAGGDPGLRGNSGEMSRGDFLVHIAEEDDTFHGDMYERGATSCVRDAHGKLSPARLMVFALWAGLMVAMGCVWLLHKSIAVPGWRNVVSTDLSSSFEECNITVTQAFAVPREYSSKCDTSSPDFKFGNEAELFSGPEPERLLRVRFSFASLVFIAASVVQAVSASLSSPAQAIPDIDTFKPAPEDGEDMSLRVCPGNEMIRLGNLVPDFTHLRSAQSHWSTLPVTKDNFGTFLRIAENMAKTVKGGRRRTVARYQVENTLRVLFASPQRTRIAGITVNMPWSAKSAMYIFLGQLLLMVLMLARQSYLSVPSYYDIVAGGTWTDISDWVKLAFRQEMLWPVVFKLYVIYLNMSNVHAFFRGRAERSRSTRLAIGVAILVTAFPIIVIFFIPVTVWALVSLLLCMGLCCACDQLLLPLMSRWRSQHRVTAESGGAESGSSVFWRWPYWKNQPTLIPFLVSASAAVVIVDHLFYSLSAETYLCSHSKITFMQKPSAADFFNTNASSHQIPIFDCIIGLAIVSAFLMVLDLVHIRCLRFFTDPLVQYELWAQQPMFNTRAYRFDFENYQAHKRHFVRNEKPVACKYCNLAYSTDVEADAGERLTYKMMGWRYEVSQIEHHVAEAERALVADATDIGALLLHKGHLGEMLTAKDSRYVEAWADQKQSDDFKRAIDDCVECHQQISMILEDFTRLEGLLRAKDVARPNQLREAIELLQRRLKEAAQLAVRRRANKLGSRSEPVSAPSARRGYTIGGRLMDEAEKRIKQMEVHRDQQGHLAAENESVILCQAASTNDVAKLKGMISDRKSAFDVNRGDYDDRTAMHLAASCGHIEAVRCLHEELHAQLSPIDRWGGTPLDDAVRHEHQEVATYLRKHQAKMGLMGFHKVDGGATTLCNLAKMGDVEQLRVLLTEHRGIDANRGDYDDRTALHIAASEGNLEVVKLLIANFAVNDSPIDRWGGTPLDDALRHGRHAVAKYLQGRGAKKGLMSNSVDEVAAAEMCKAASKNDVRHLRVLVERHDLKVNNCDYDKRTAMHLAASEGNLEAVKLLAEEFKADLSIIDRWGGTPLDDATRHKHAQVKEYLVKKKAKKGLTGQQDSSGNFSTKLCSAAAKGDIRQVQSLLDNHGQSINIGDYDKRTALHLAASEGDLQAVKTMIEKLEANHSPLDRWEGTPLDDAMRHGHGEVAEYLKACGAQKGMMSSSPQESASTEMCRVGFEGDIHHLRSLLTVHSLDVNAGDYDERTVMHLAASEGHLAVIRMLVEEFNAITSPVDRWGGTPLDDAIRHERVEVQDYLQSRGAKQGRQAGQWTKDTLAIDLCQAAAAGDEIRLRRIAREHPRGVDIGDYDGRTAMHLAASEGMLNAVAVMIEEFQANPSPTDRWGGTPLDDALRHGHDRVANYLKEKGAFKGLMSSSPAENAATEMCKVACEGDVGHLERLLSKHELDVNTGDYDRRTAMHLAASEGQLETVRAMVEKFGANLSPRDRWGNTPLDDAKREHHSAVQRYLEERQGHGDGKGVPGWFK